jgi:hypothetical protein
MQILASFEIPKFRSEGRRCLRHRSRSGVCPCQAADYPDPISPTIPRDSIASSAFPYAGERIFMGHHEIWVSPFGPGTRLSVLSGL